MQISNVAALWAPLRSSKLHSQGPPLRYYDVVTLERALGRRSLNSSAGALPLVDRWLRRPPNAGAWVCSLLGDLRSQGCMVRGQKKKTQLIILICRDIRDALL